jgi:hypothetical protein
MDVSLLPPLAASTHNVYLEVYQTAEDTVYGKPEDKSVPTQEVKHGILSSKIK